MPLQAEIKESKPLCRATKFSRVAAGEYANNRRSSSEQHDLAGRAGTDIRKRRAYLVCELVADIRFLNHPVDANLAEGSGVRVSRHEQDRQAWRLGLRLTCDLHPVQ
jgi:hypothetical protein